MADRDPNKNKMKKKENKVDGKTALEWNIR